MRAVLWRSVDGSLERCALVETRAGARLAGTVLTGETGAPLELRYAVDVDSGWRTRRAEVRITDGASLSLESDGRGHWSIDGRRLPELDGCTDVDLEFTPATNALPVRRLRLAEGQSADLRAAWVRFPGLSVEPNEQRYQRLEGAGYRYLSGGFSADLEVADDGLVIRYGELWETVAGS